MSDALKEMYTVEFLQEFSEKVHAVFSNFEPEQFVAAVLAQPWPELPLMARMRRIAEKLGEFLPARYEDALETLFSIDADCCGFPYLFFPEYVALFGQREEHWELSMRALERFTQRSSSEFAIRPFLLREPEWVMERMKRWAQHPNEHVRRFSSEGCRPRLPWGVALPVLKKDPAPVLAVLELLKADTSLYVRKSVANNLNDIAKDNPAAVLEAARRWIGQNPNTDWILRQGCRTLIRKANPVAMELFGYADFSKKNISFQNAALSVSPKELSIGESCELSYSIEVTGSKPSHIRLEYGVDFIKANGKPARKLFLLTDKTIPGESCLSGTRKHSFAELTTRRHYPGLHKITLLLNGQEAAQTELYLMEGKNDCQ